MKYQFKSNKQQDVIKNALLKAIILPARVLAGLPYPLLYRFGVLVGSVMYYTNYKHRRIVNINLDLCFPDKSKAEKKTIAKNNFRYFGIAFMECAMLWLGPKRAWQDMVEIKGFEHYQKALEKGKGAFLLGIHLTSLEVVALLGTKIPLFAVYRPNENAVIEETMVKGRQRFLQPIPRDNTRKVVRCLKNNAVVWYAPDQDFGPIGSVFVPLFNIPAATLTATSRFVRLTGATVIPLTQVRIGKGKKVTFTMHSPLAVDGEDEVRDAKLMNEFIEGYVKNFPEEYFWNHKRFKTRPHENQASFYPEKKGWRKVTPAVYDYLLSKAEWVESKNGEPYKIKNYQGIIYFVYRENQFPFNLKPPYKSFVEKLQPEIIEDKTYSFQGVVRYCKFKNCDLVYLQETA